MGISTRAEAEAISHYMHEYWSKISCYSSYGRFRFGTIRYADSDPFVFGSDGEDLCSSLEHVCDRSIESTGVSALALAINADLSDEIKRFANTALLALDATVDDERASWEEPMDDNELGQCIRSPPTRAEVATLLVVHVRSRFYGCAVEVGIAYEVLDRVVSETKVTVSEMCAKEPAPCCRTIMSMALDIPISSPLLYKLDMPPPNASTSVLARDQDGRNLSVRRSRTTRRTTVNAAMIVSL